MPLTEQEITKQERERQLQEQRLADHAKCVRDAEHLRDVTAGYLPSVLSQGCKIELRTGTPERPQSASFHLIVTSSDGHTYRVRFYVASTNHWARPRFSVHATGDTYVRNKRRYEPKYEHNKAGVWPLRRIADDIMRAFDHAREAKRHNEAFRANYSASDATLDDIIAATGAEKPYGSVARLKVNDLQVRVESGNYSDGKVKVSIDFAQFMSRDEALAFVERLRGAK